MSWSKITFFIFQVNLIFLLFSCPEPISENYLARLKDTVGPEIIIYELENGSVYLNTINIKGKVVDNTSTASQPGAVTTLTYEVSGGLNIENTKVTLDQTGAFEFTIIAGTKTKGSISIKLTATDWNGNTKTTVLTLYDDAITGISILSRNKGAELIWEELPLTNDYTIYFEIGTTPTIESKNKIAVPRTSLTNIDTTSNKVSYTLYLPDIKNGCQLHILLQANMLKGAPNLFPPQTTIPLSPLTLTPTIKEGYNQLELEWPAIEATVGYEIYRSTVRDASYSCIATTAPNVTSYEDENVNAGDLYFYKVCPAGYHEEVLSRMAANSGKTFFLPPLVHNMNLLTPDPRIIKNYTNSDILRANDSINDIIIKDDFVYVLEYETGVHEFEISNPGNPTYKRSWPAGGKDVHSLYLSDEFPSLIFALGYKELYMIDISKDVNANGAVLLAGFESKGMTLNDIVIKNKLAYVAAAQQGLQILDLTDPANPESQPPFDVDSTGNTGDNTLCSLGIDQMDHLFVGDIPVRGEPSIFGFDINALHPALKNRLSVVDGPINLVAKGNKIYYCYSTNLARIEVTTGNICKPVSFKNDGFNETLDPFIECFNIIHNYNLMNRPFAIEGDMLCTLSQNTSEFKLYLVSLSDETDPGIAGVVELGTKAYAVAIKDNYAYVAGDTSLIVVDISLPASSTSAVSSAKQLKTLQNSTDIALRDECAYLVSQDDGLSIIDIASSSPQPKGSLFRSPSDARYNSITIQGDYAFITDTSYGLHKLDVSDPADPKLIRTYSLKDSLIAKRVVIRGDYAYVSSDSLDTLHRIDISNPPDKDFSHTVICNFGNNLGGLFLDDSSLYFSGKSNGLNRLHIADKTITQPQLNENISSNEGAAKVITVFDDYLFLNGGNSLNSIDCYAVGTYIQHIRSIDLEDPIHDLLVYNNLLFAANDSAGLKIFSAAITPGYRGLIRSYAYLTVRKTTAGVVRDHEVYLADAENGLVIIDLRPDFSN